MQKLHREEDLAVLLADRVHLNNVRVVQGRRDPRLVEEHPHEFLVVGVLRKDSLEHHEALEAAHPLLASEENLGHAADCNPAQDDVVAHLRGFCWHRSHDYRG